MKELFSLSGICCFNYVSNYIHYKIFPNMHISLNKRSANAYFRSSHWRCSIKIGVLKNFAKLTGKHLCQIKKETLAHVQATASELLGATCCMVARTIWQKLIFQTFTLISYKHKIKKIRRSYHSVDVLRKVKTKY